jgi:hypothetical protein
MTLMALNGCHDRAEAGARNWMGPGRAFNVTVEMPGWKMSKQLRRRGIRACWYAVAAAHIPIWDKRRKWYAMVKPPRNLLELAEAQSRCTWAHMYVRYVGTQPLPQADAEALAKRVFKGWLRGKHAWWRQLPPACQAAMLEALTAYTQAHGWPTLDRLAAWKATDEARRRWLEQHDTGYVPGPVLRVWCARRYLSNQGLSEADIARLLPLVDATMQGRSGLTVTAIHALAQDVMLQHLTSPEDDSTPTAGIESEA